MLGLAALAVLALAAPAAAQDFPEPTGHVVDAADTIPPDSLVSIERRLSEYERGSGNEVAVAVVESTGRLEIEDYAEQLFDEWGVGKEGEDNGVLLVLAMDDRRLRIEVGYGVEDELTDLESSVIIRDRIVPRLKAEDVDGAVDAGVTGILEALGGELVGTPAPQPAAAPRPRSGSPFSVLVLVFFVFMIISSLGSRGRRRRGLDAGDVVLPWIIGSSIGRGWGGGGGVGGGGGFGGGGFGGFGGGGSGGGGASGDW